MNNIDRLQCFFLFQARNWFKSSDKDYGEVCEYTPKNKVNKVWTFQNQNILYYGLSVQNKSNKHYQKVGKDDFGILV